MRLSQSFICVFICLIISSIILQGCSKDPFSDLTPKEAVIKANEKLFSLNGYKFQLDTSIKTSNSTNKLQLSGFCINPDLIYLKGKLNNVIIEIVSHNTTVYIKHPLSGKWLPQNNNFFKNIIKTPHEVFNAAKDYITEAEYIGEEDINNKPTKIVEFNINNFELLSAFDNVDKNVLKQIYDKIKYTSKLWIGKKDFYIYKMEVNFVITLNNGEKQTISSIISLHDHNKPVKIPEEVKKLIN